jgi:hypothetical protein
VENNSSFLHAEWFLQTPMPDGSSIIEQVVPAENHSIVIVTYSFEYGQRYIQHLSANG